MSEEIINPSLNYIRGYRDVNDARERDYAYEYESYDAFITNFIAIVNDLVRNLYPYAESHIQEEIEELPTMKWGPDIRYTIVKILRAIYVSYALPITHEVSLIKNAHYGREMREPIFNAFMKMGANQEFLYKAVSSDFIYTDIGNNNALLIRYIGPHRPKIILPGTVEDPEDSENELTVTALYSTLFSDVNWLTYMKLPEGITAIY